MTTTGINPQVTGLSLWVGFAPFSNLRACGARLVKVASLTLVAGGMTQVVEVGNRDVGERLETRIPMHKIHPLAELFRSRATGCAMQFIKLCQQQGILRGVVALKPNYRTLTALHLPTLTVLCYQPGVSSH